MAYIGKSANSQTFSKYLDLLRDSHKTYVNNKLRSWHIFVIYNKIFVQFVLIAPLFFKINKSWNITNKSLHDLNSLAKLYK